MNVGLVAKAIEGDLFEVIMADIAMVVTNACAPDPRVERHARWLVDAGHTVTIHAWDRMCIHPENDSLKGYNIRRYRFGNTKYSSSIRTWFRKKKFISNLRINARMLIYNDTDTGNISFNGLKLLDIHDMAHTWPLMRGNSFVHRFASHIMLANAKKIIKSADEIIVSAPGFSNWISGFGRDSTVIMNRRNPEFLSPCEEKVIGYFGRIREFDSIEMLYKAANNSGFKLILAGDGSAVAKVMETYPDIDYRGAFDEDDLPGLMKEVSVMYAMYNTNRGNISNGAIPTKMLDSAAFGRPSIVNSDTPMGEMCESEGLGVTAVYGDIEDISKAMELAHGMEITNVAGEDRDSFISVIEKLLD